MQHCLNKYLDIYLDISVEKVGTTDIFSEICSFIVEFCLLYPFWLTWYE